MSGDDWYYERDEQRVGPFRREELLRMFGAGIIPAATAIIGPDAFRTTAEELSEVLSPQREMQRDTPSGEPRGPENENTPPPPPPPPPPVTRPSSSRPAVDSERASAPIKSSTRLPQIGGGVVVYGLWKLYQIFVVNKHRKGKKP